MKSLASFLKAFRLETILTSGYLPFDRGDIWFEDKARFGKQNITTRMWVPKGSRSRTIKLRQFEYAYLFGAVCPSNGNTEALIAPYSYSDIMKEYLSLIFQATPSVGIL